MELMISNGEISISRFALLVRVNVVVAACKGQKRELAEKPSGDKSANSFSAFNFLAYFLSAAYGQCVHSIYPSVLISFFALCEV